MKIVLVETTHPGNIGAVARAMKTMGLHHLVLVKPKYFPSEEANARASGAKDILEAASVVQTLEEAIKDCNLVIGTSARRRSKDWVYLDPKQAINLAADQVGNGRVAFVFGRESSGLSNNELNRCTHLLHIPTNENYSSLNLAMAVQIISYEYQIRNASNRSNSKAGIISDPATSEQMEGFFVHLEQALSDLEFLQRNRETKLMRRLRRFFFRASPNEQELNILRGILSSAQGQKSMRDSKNSPQ